MTSDFGYKVIMQAGCGAKRFVAFHSEDMLNDEDIYDEAPQHLSSQTCPRCGENHDDYFVISSDCTVH